MTETVTDEDGHTFLKLQIEGLRNDMKEQIEYLHDSIERTQRFSDIDKIKAKIDQMQVDIERINKLAEAIVASSHKDTQLARIRQEIAEKENELDGLTTLAEQLEEAFDEIELKKGIRSPD